jgi:hypothetical protein
MSNMNGNIDSDGNHTLISSQDDTDEKAIVSDVDDPVDEMDDDEEDEEDIVNHISSQDMIELLDELSSSRPDSIQTKKRNELIEKVTNACKKSEDFREILSEWQGMCLAIRTIEVFYTL